jgi:hypothetical protein
MKVDAFASMRHYAEHLYPIWEQLPEQVRGVFWAPGRNHDWGKRLARRDIHRLVLTAAWQDAKAMRLSPTVYVEHGSGQSYDGDPKTVAHVGYSGGGDKLDHVRLFICPNETVAGRWRDVFPGTPVAVVGCPKLDRWHSQPSGRIVDGEAPTVAVTFHWENRVIPETTSAWRYYDRVLPALAADKRWHLIGHGHPRLWGEGHRTAISNRWQQLNVPRVPQFADVLDQADLLVGDNTSALYEFASTGRPVVVMNAPWYRRDVNHGLRFWDYPPGLQVDRPEQLAPTIVRALNDPVPAQALRAAAVGETYAYTDGHAAERAVTAIEELLE